jgi:ribosomal protein L11 methyltransferase
MPPQQQQRWAEVEVAVQGDAREIVGAVLMHVAGCPGYAETASTVTGYLPVDDRLEGTLHALRNALRELPDAATGVNPEITIRFVDEADWANAWKQFFTPQRIGRRLVVKPTWEEWAAAPGDVVVQIDPGMAFGTGLHATTRLCLRALEERIRLGMRVADVGTGSGILAVAAALLGASEVAAVDIDPLAVRIARRKRRHQRGPSGSSPSANRPIRRPAPSTSSSPTSSPTSSSTWRRRCAAPSRLAAC